MTLKKPRKIIAFGFIGIVFLVVMFVGAYINNIGFHNLKLMYTLSTTEKLIVPMDKVGHYLAREDRSVELLKERMSSKGWSYVEQEGSNYFLKREMKKRSLPCSNGIINISSIRLKITSSI